MLHVIFLWKKGLNVLRVKHGKRQEVESAINEEAMLLASFIRGKRIWKPGTVPLANCVISLRQKKRKTNLKSFFGYKNNLMI